MKKIFFTSICIVSLVYYSHAQKATFGINAGATFATYKATEESISITSKTQTGFTVGLTASAPLSKDFSIRPQLNFVQKGGKQEEDEASEKLTLNYIELPLNFVFNTHTSNGMFFIGAGPSLSFGLSGKDKYDYGTEPGSYDIKFGSGGDADFKPFEIGANILAGYQFAGGFFVAVNYNAALNNVAQDDPEFDSKYHNRYFGIRLGYMFHSKPKVSSENK